MRRTFYTLLALTGLFIACTEKATLDTDDIEIRFSIGLASATQTRLSTYDDFTAQFDQEDAIGLFIYKRPTNINSNIEINELYANNIKAVYQNGNWILETPLYYSNDGSLLDIYAYYPYTSEAQAQALNYDASTQMADFLIASAKGIEKQKGQAVPLRFKHTLALIHLTIYKGEGLFGMDDSFQAYFHGKTGSNYHIGTGAWSQPSEGVVAMHLVGEEDEDTRVYRAWVPTQDMDKGQKIFTFVQTTSDKAFSLRDFLETAVHLRAGKAYKHRQVLGSYAETQQIYQLYDPYPKYGDPVGMVIEVYNNGRNGKLISLVNNETPWSALYEITGSTDYHDGISNMMKVQARPDWRTLYPAFAACADLGEGWYLPSLDESYPHIKADINNLNYHLANIPESEPIDGGNAYWTSTEVSASNARRILGGNAYTDDRDKTELGKIRAFYMF